MLSLILCWILSYIYMQRSSWPEFFCKKCALRNFAEFKGKHLCHSLFFNKVSGNFIKKKTLAQVFSCEFCEISKSTFFYRTPPVAASGKNPQHSTWLDKLVIFWYNDRIYSCSRALQDIFSLTGFLRLYTYLLQICSLKIIAHLSDQYQNSGLAVF